MDSRIFYLGNCAQVKDAEKLLGMACNPKWSTTFLFVLTARNQFGAGSKRIVIHYHLSNNY
jgi:hypothetical protein